MSDLSLKERILKAIESIPEDAFSEKTKQLDDPDIKKVIEMKLSQGVSIVKLHETVSPDLVHISKTHFYRWLNEAGLIKKKKKKKTSLINSGKGAKNGSQG